MATTRTPSRAPSRASIALTLLAAAVIGFLLGALVAVTDEEPTAAPGSTAGPTASPSPPPPTTDASPQASVDAELTLSADRSSAETGELIRLTGVLSPATDGAEVTVQQSVDGIGFVDFPVEPIPTRSDGSFGLRVRTGRVGTNEFRVLTQVDGQQVTSNPVTVQISQ